MSDPQNANIEKGDTVTINADQSKTPSTVTEKLPEGDVGSASDPSVLVSRQGDEGAGEIKNVSEVTKVGDGSTSETAGGGDVEMKDAGAGVRGQGESGHTQTPASAEQSKEDTTKEGKPAEVGEKRAGSGADLEEEVEAKKVKVDEGQQTEQPEGQAPKESESESHRGADGSEETKAQQDSEVQAKETPAQAQEQVQAEPEPEAPKNRRSSRIKKEAAPVVKEAPAAKKSSATAGGGGGGAGAGAGAGTGTKRGPGRPKKVQGGEEAVAVEKVEGGVENGHHDGEGATSANGNGNANGS